MRSRVGIAAIAVVVVAAAVVVGIAIGSHGSAKAHRSSTRPPSTPVADVQTQSPDLSPGSVSGQGAATFLGRASNATFPIQWTRSGSSVSGTIQESVVEGAGQPLSTDSSSFSGQTSGNGLTLNLGSGLAGASALTGQMQGDGFVLTFPGASTGTDITIPFHPSSVGAYNNATMRINARQYNSPCVLYLNGHAAIIQFDQAYNEEACAQFVQLDGSGDWSPNPTVGVQDGATSTVCKLTDGTTTAIVTDAGSMSYGTSACQLLESNGWSSTG